MLVTRSLSINDGGFLDLQNNDLVLDYSGASPLGTWNGSAYTGVSGLVASGYDAGAWHGSGIRTSVADSTIELGVAEASLAFNIADAQTRLFDGQTVDASAVLVKYTYAGDANLDGKLDISDLGHLDFNLPIHTNGWFNGDFNYDGKIDISDYGMLDFMLPIQGPPV